MILQVGYRARKCSCCFCDKGLRFPKLGSLKGTASCDVNKDTMALQWMSAFPAASHEGGSTLPLPKAHFLNLNVRALQWHRSAVATDTQPLHLPFLLGWGKRGCGTLNFYHLSSWLSRGDDQRNSQRKVHVCSNDTSEDFLGLLKEMHDELLQRDWLAM